MRPRVLTQLGAEVTPRLWGSRQTSRIWDPASLGRFASCSAVRPGQSPHPLPPASTHREVLGQSPQRRGLPATQLAEGKWLGSGPGLPGSSWSPAAPIPAQSRAAQAGDTKTRSPGDRPTLHPGPGPVPCLPAWALPRNELQKLPPAPQGAWSCLLCFYHLGLKVPHCPWASTQNGEPSRL